MQKISCIKWTYGRSSSDYRVASLFTGWLISKGIIPESKELNKELDKVNYRADIQ